MNDLSEKSLLTIMEEEAAKARQEFDLPTLRIIDEEAEKLMEQMEPNDPKYEAYQSFRVLCDGFARVVKARKAVLADVSRGEHGAD